MPRQIGWKARLIHPSSATSMSLANLSVLAELLFWRILPQADDQGRLTGGPKLLKAITCPIREEITAENITALLEEMEQESAQLIIRYHESNTELIQIRNWWAYQSMQWAYPSDYPSPENWQDHLRYKKGGKVITENWPPTGKATGEALPKPTPEEIPMLGQPLISEVPLSNEQINPTMAKLSQAYEREIGQITPIVGEKLKHFAEEHPTIPLEWIDQAVSEAVEHNARNWAYVKAILKNWVEQGKGMKKSRDRRLPTEEEIRKSVEEAQR